MTVDRRADIWAFGAVLFEMLSGRQIYARKTTLETLAAVARDEPRWDELLGGDARGSRQIAAELPRERPEAEIASHRRLAFTTGRSAAASEGSRRETALDCGGSDDNGRGGFSDCPMGSGAGGEAGGPSAGAAGCRFGSGCFVARADPRWNQRRHLPRWNAASIRLRHATETVHPAAGSTESHRAPRNPGSVTSSVLLAGWAVGRIPRR